MSEFAASYLPHPWDSFGTPPPLGEPLANGDIGGHVAEVLRLIHEAQEYDERASELEADAEDERDQARDLRSEAEDIIEDEIAPVDPTQAADLMRRLGRA